LTLKSTVQIPARPADARPTVGGSTVAPRRRRTSANAAVRLDQHQAARIRRPPLEAVRMMPACNM
jgi:hypothetical protein